MNKRKGRCVLAGEVPLLREKRSKIAANIACPPFVSGSNEIANASVRVERNAVAYSARPRSRSKTRPVFFFTARM